MFEPVASLHSILCGMKSVYGKVLVNRPFTNGKLNIDGQSDVVDCVSAPVTFIVISKTKSSLILFSAALRWLIECFCRSVIHTTRYRFEFFIGRLCIL